jgi:glycosyltransferase involved in cell wall biosynthesis
MKILCFIDSLGSGGAQRQLVQIAIGLKEKGHDVEFLVYHHAPFFNPALEKNGIKIHLVEEKNPIKRILKVRRFVKKHCPESIISFLETPVFISELIASPFRKWKLIVGERSADPNIGKSFKRRMYRWLHFRADYIVANSQANIDLIKRINPFLPNRKLKVIYNVFRYENVEKIHSSIQNTFNDKFILTVVASHQLWKNAAGLIEAINLLTDEKKLRLRVHWYGDKYRDCSYICALELIQLYKLEDVFLFYDHEPEIFEKIYEGNALGLFSFFEGFPNVVCEAMILGKPVVASKVSDLPFFLEHKFLFDPNKPLEISTSIANLMEFSNEELLEIGKANRIKALALFDSEKNIVNYEQLLME